MTFAEFLKSVGAVEGSIAAAYYGAAWGAATAAERERFAALLPKWLIAARDDNRIDLPRSVRAGRLMRRA